ncbi:MAG TPA: hypothetical protein VN445_09840 [Rectinemataceae bacterium]|nr:hypothetical protein [Rectinemataceae bacterium]
MKKFAVVVLFALIAVGFSFAQPATAVTTDSGTLSLLAHVNQYIDLSIDRVTGADGNEFTLLAAGVSAHKVATATMTTNYKKWIVQVYSNNGSKLVRDTTDDPVGVTMTEDIPYTFAFVQTTGAHTWTEGYVTLPDTAYPTSGAGYYEKTGKTVIAGEPVDMKIAISAQSATEFWDAGIYTDTVNVKISVD